MTDWKLRLYHQLPHPLRNVAASLRGYQLRRWRYGPETERLVEETLERDTWSAAQWKAYQENRLAYVLHRAATRVPYYREQWQERRRKGNRASWEYLENWPILTKQILRDGPESFVADDCRISNMFREQTSGTTGTPLKLWWSRETTIAWYALFEARCRIWNKVSSRENWAIFGGQQVIPPKVQEPPFWVWNRALNQLYLSANHVSERNAAYFIDAIQKHDVTHLVTYTSSATYLAQQILTQSLSHNSGLQAIITNAEPLFDWQRRVLQEAFGCPVRETYGMGEIVAGASADQHDRLRIWPEVGIIEVYDDGTNDEVADGKTGDLVCTGLLNADMPLVRYEVGDRGSLCNEEVSEENGIKLPHLGKIVGRSNDLLVARDGRRIFWINPIFYGLPIAEAQVQQVSLERIKVLYVPKQGFSSKTLSTITDRLKERIGELEVGFDEVSSIPRESNGKFRAVINNLSPEELPKL